VTSVIDADTLHTGQLSPTGGSRSTQFNMVWSNGPSTFAQACDHLGFTHEEAQKFALGCTLVSSLSQILSPVTGPIPHARCAAPHSYPQQISGTREYTNIASSSIVPPTDLQPCVFPSFSASSPPLPTSPNLEHVQHRTILTDQATGSTPGRAEPLNSSSESPLTAFTNRRNGTFHCLVPIDGELCGYVNKKRNRMLGHIRGKHLDQRPWHCRGQCGNHAW